MGKSLECQVICVSGKFEGYTQEDMETLVTNNGATVSSSVTKKTTMLVTGDKVGASKLSKAQELGIKIVPQNEFFKMVEDGLSSNNASNLEEHKVRISFYCRTYGFWSINPIDKDALKNFVVENSDVMTREDFLNLKTANEVLKSSIYSSFDSFGHPDNHDLWEECSDISISVDGGDYESVFDNVKNNISVNVIKKDVCNSDLYLFAEEGGHGYLFTSDEITVKGNFDISKLSVEIVETDFNGDTYKSSSILYDGKHISGSVGETDPSFNSVDLIELKKEKESKIDVSVEIRGGELVIPDGITEIEDNQYANLDNITSIVFPDSLTKIGDAFIGCSNLTKVVISKNITEISESAFWNCAKLTNIEVAKGHPCFSSVDGVLYNKSKSNVIICPYGKDSIVLPKTVKKIGDFFSRAAYLKSIELSPSMKSIEEDAFSECTRLTNVVIPDSVMEIGKYAFRKCTSLTKISIPASVSEIDPKAFYECDNLISIDVAEENSKYSSVDGVLYNKNKIAVRICPLGKEEVVIPDTVTVIGECAFYGCNNLKKVTIPNSVKKIEGNALSGAFYGCTSLSDIEIPNSVTTIGGCAFYGCTNLTKVIIPNSVKEIEEDAFSGCMNLTQIVISESVTYVGPSRECPNLTTVDVAAENNTYCSIDGVLYDKKQKQLIWCPTCKEEVVLPDFVSKIGYRAFSGYTNLKKVVLSESLTELGFECFKDCVNLTEIRIPDSIQMMGWNTFYGCTNLKKVSVPGSCQFNKDDFFDNPNVDIEVR